LYFVHLFTSVAPALSPSPLCDCRRHAGRPLTLLRTGGLESCTVRPSIPLSDPPRQPSFCHPLPRPALHFTSKRSRDGPFGHRNTSSYCNATPAEPRATATLTSPPTLSKAQSLAIASPLCIIDRCSKQDETSMPRQPWSHATIDSIKHLIRTSRDQELLLRRLHSTTIPQTMHGSLRSPHRYQGDTDSLMS